MPSSRQQKPTYAAGWQATLHQFAQAVEWSACDSRSTRRDVYPEEAQDAP